MSNRFEIKVTKKNPLECAKFSDNEYRNFQQSRFWAEFKAMHGWDFIELHVSVAKTADERTTAAKIHSLSDVDNGKNVETETSHNGESAKSDKECESPMCEVVKTPENTKPTAGDYAKTVENYASPVGDDLNTAKNTVSPMSDDIKTSIEAEPPSGEYTKIEKNDILPACNARQINVKHESPLGRTVEMHEKSASHDSNGRETMEDYMPLNVDSVKTSADSASRVCDGANLDEDTISLMGDGTKKDVFGISRGSQYDENEFARVFVLTRSFAKGLFSIAYVPLYPIFPSNSVSALEFCEMLEKIAFAIRPFLPKNAICIRFDPALEFNSATERDDFITAANSYANENRISLKKTDVDIQPPDTSLVSLERSEDEILSSMKSKWRYNINLASRKGVKIERVGVEVVPLRGNESENGNSCETAASREEFFADLSSKVDEFYEVYRITSARDGIAIHSKQYYLDLLKKSASERFDGKDIPFVCLYIARHENDVLGAIITLVTRREGIYLYGASNNVKRNLMPNFLLQWTAMKDARNAGAKYYDLYGIPPTDDERHPMHGLFLFKSGFGGNNIHRVGTFDVPLSGIYAFCSLAERARAWWHKKFLKKIRGR